MNRILATNLIALLTSRIASAFVAVTAAGAGDNTAVNGLVLDRQALKMPSCAEVDVLFQATLAADATLSVTAFKVQDSADGATFADYEVFAAPGVVATGPGGGGTVRGQVRKGVNLSSARRYVRVVFTPDLSAANTDTASLVASAAFSGFDALPAAA
jgi:hypothetical protein